MAVHHKLLWVLGLAALAAVSLGGFLVSSGALPPTVVGAAMQWMYGFPGLHWLIALIFAILFILSVYLPYATWAESGDTAVVTLRNPLGEIDISQKAISDFIQKVGREVEGIQDLHARVRSDDEGLDVFVTLSAESRGELPRLIDELQKVIKDYLTTTVGIENVRQIRARIGKIITEQAH